LSQVLQIFAGFSTIPPEFLQGALKGQTLSPPDGTTPVTLNLPKPNRYCPRGSAEECLRFLDSTGQPTAPIADCDCNNSYGCLYALEKKKVSGGKILFTGGILTNGESAVRMVGCVTDATNAPVAHAVVKLPQLGLSTTTDN
jgi:hypothetical protein